MKRAGKMLVIGLFSLLLSGCMFTTPETSLYRLPKLAGEYESLESQIDALLTNGAEYAAPTSGSNLQSVQMIDLDGDGSEEAVAFFRRASDKKPMKIYIFKADGDSYERYAVIEGTSSQIYSVNYADLDGDGLKEILVGYKSSSDVPGACHLSALSRHVGVAFDDGLFPLREPRHERRREAGTFNYLQRRREYGARRLLRLG